MKKAPVIAVASALIVLGAVASARQKQPDLNGIVELEYLTHTEVYDKIRTQGFPNVLIVTGGTEERGPHTVLGGHTIMSRYRAIEIAKRLGKTLVAPILPVALQATGLRENTDRPGAISVPA